MAGSDTPLDELGTGLPAALTAPDPDSPAGAIFAAARELFADRGFSGTSTRRIAGQAGVNLAMIHYYFGNKEQLYRRIIEVEFLNLHRVIQEALPAGSDSRDIILHMPVFALRLHRRHPQLTRLILREMADGAPRLPRILAELGEHGPLGLGRALREQLETGQNQGSVIDLPPEHLLAVLFAVGNGLQAFAPMAKAVFGVDLADEKTLTGLETTIETIFRRALAPGNKERS